MACTFSLSWCPAVSVSALSAQPAVLACLGAPASSGALESLAAPSAHLAGSSAHLPAPACLGAPVSLVARSEVLQASAARVLQGSLGVASVEDSLPVRQSCVRPAP